MTFWELLFLIIIVVLIYLFVEAGVIILIIAIVLLVAYYLWTNYIKTSYERFGPSQLQMSKPSQPCEAPLLYDNAWYVPLHQYFDEKINYNRTKYVPSDESNRWQSPSPELQQLWNPLSCNVPPSYVQTPNGIMQVSPSTSANCINEKLKNNLFNSDNLC